MFLPRLEEGCVQRRVSCGPTCRICLSLCANDTMFSRSVADIDTQQSRVLCELVVTAGYRSRLAVVLGKPQAESVSLSMLLADGACL